MDSSWASIASQLLEIAPYGFFFALSFVGAYFMYKVSLKNIKEFAEKSLEEIRQVYKEAFSSCIKK